MSHYQVLNELKKKWKKLASEYIPEPYNIRRARSSSTVSMWHFGADALVEYSGEKFSATWETAENALIRAYSKVTSDNRTRIRLERQEYPKATLANLIEQRINRNKRSGD